MDNERLRGIEERLAARPERGHWTEGTAGNCNVVQFDGDDISGVAWVPDLRNAPLIASAPDDIAYLLWVARAAERLMDHMTAPGHAHADDSFMCNWPCPAHDYDELRRALEGTPAEEK